MIQTAPCLEGKTSIADHDRHIKIQKWFPNNDLEKPHADGGDSETERTQLRREKVHDP